MTPNPDLNLALRVLLWEIAETLRSEGFKMGRLPALFLTLLAILDVLPPRSPSAGGDVETGIRFAILTHGHVLTLRHRHCYN